MGGHGNIPHGNPMGMGISQKNLGMGMGGNGNWIDGNGREWECWKPFPHTPTSNARCASRQPGDVLHRGKVEQLVAEAVSGPRDVETDEIAPRNNGIGRRVSQNDETQRRSVSWRKNDNRNDNWNCDQRRGELIPAWFCPHRAIE